MLNVQFGRAVAKGDEIDLTEAARKAFCYNQYRAGRQMREIAMVKTKTR